MALPYKLEKLDSLAKEFHEHYRKDGDHFVLDVEGGEDVAALKRAKDYETKEKNKALGDAAKLREQVTGLENERDEMLKGHIPKGDAEKLENSYKDKIDKLTADHQTAIDSATGTIKTLLVDNVAHGMASSLAVEGSADVLLPHISKRLAVDTVDGKHVTRVLDADGKPSALTVEDLKKEISSNKAFAPVIVAGKATGGGASGGGTGGGAPNKKPDFATASPQEIAAYTKQKLNNPQNA